MERRIKETLGSVTIQSRKRPKLLSITAGLDNDKAGIFVQ
jgi:hypothetical protein